MRHKLFQKSYFFLCVSLLVILSSFRSSPVYGKLDFILLDGRPWWNLWQPMIEKTLDMGSQPILSDSITSTVLRAVFAQPAVVFRFENSFSDVHTLETMNRPIRKHLPAGAMVLLLQDHYSGSFGGHVLKDEPRGMQSIKQLMAEAVTMESIHGAREKENTPYRCIINLQGFTSSWVPAETGHWSKWLSYSSSLYTLQGVPLSDPNHKIIGQPFDNCTVFY